MKYKKLLKIFLFILLLVPSFTFAKEELVGEIFKGKVVEIVSETEEENFLSQDLVKIQNLKVEDKKTGEIVDVYNDYTVVSVGQKIFYSVNDFGGGEYQNYLVEVSRINQIILLTILFIVVVALFSGVKGIRSLLSLVLSFFAIIFVMIPLILKGVDPIIIGPLLAFLILFFAIFFSYGFNKISGVAFAGTSITVVITSILAFLSIKLFSLSGISDGTLVYLSFLPDLSINLINLVIVGIIIGVLGVLDDIAVTQVAVVRELYLANEKITEKEVYKRAISVGQDHVSALVNTLVLAYTGVALPLILYFKLSNGSFASIVSGELVATEIVRTIVGSIGVVLAVPITTILAVKILGKNRKSLSGIKFEGGHSHGHDHHGHSHPHSH
jgi:uncharacterized membrane protein